MLDIRMTMAAFINIVRTIIGTRGPAKRKRGVHLGNGGVGDNALVGHVNMLDDSETGLKQTYFANRSQASIASLMTRMMGLVLSHMAASTCFFAGSCAETSPDARSFA